MSEPTIQSWIAEYAYPRSADVGNYYNWGIIIINDDGLVSMIREDRTVFNKKVYWSEKTNPLSGIHIYHLLIVVNIEKHPQHIQNSVHAITTSGGSRVIPHG